MKLIFTLSLSLFAPFTAAMQLAYEEAEWYLKPHTDFYDVGKQAAPKLLRINCLKVDNRLKANPIELEQFGIMLIPELTEQAGIPFEKTKLFFSGMSEALMELDEQKLKKIYHSDYGLVVMQQELLLYICQTYMTSNSYEDRHNQDHDLVWQHRLTAVLELLRFFSSYACSKPDFMCISYAEKALSTRDCKLFCSKLLSIRSELRMGNFTSNELESMNPYIAKLIAAPKQASTFFDAENTEIHYLSTIKMVAEEYLACSRNPQSFVAHAVRLHYKRNTTRDFDEAIKIAMRALFECLAFNRAGDMHNIEDIAAHYKILIDVEFFLHDLKDMITTRCHTVGHSWIRTKLCDTLKATCLEPVNRAEELDSSLIYPPFEDLCSHYGLFKE